jgi:hypothetical protein
MKYTWRTATQEDAPALLKIMERQAKDLGYTPWFPPIADPKVEGFFVFEENGAVVGGLYFRHVTEVGLIGAHPGALRAARGAAPEIRRIMGRRGVDELIMFTDRARKSMLRILARCGLKPLEEKFQVFEGRIVNDAQKGAI